MERKSNSRKTSTNTLRTWLQENKSNPYPTKGEKIMLAVISDMSLTQISTWFANARRRLKKESPKTCLIGKVCEKISHAQRKRTGLGIMLTNQTKSIKKQLHNLPVNEVRNNLQRMCTDASDQLCKPASTSISFCTAPRPQSKVVPLLPHECKSTKSYDCLALGEFHTKSISTDESNHSNSLFQSRFDFSVEDNPAHSQTTHKESVLNSTCLNEMSSQTDQHRLVKKELTFLQPFTLTEQLDKVTSMFTFNMFQWPTQ